MTQVNGVKFYYGKVTDKENTGTIKKNGNVITDFISENKAAITTQVSPENMLAAMNTQATNNLSQVRFVVNPQIISEFKNKMGQIYKAEFDLVKQRAQFDPDSVEIQQINSRLQAIDEVKISMLNSLAEQYPAGSKEQKALQTMGSIIKEDSKVEAIDQYTKQLQGSFALLETQLAKAEPGSAEAVQLQSRIDALKQIETRLQEEKDKSLKEIKVLNRQLRINSRGIAPELRSVLAQVRISERRSDAIAKKAGQAVIQEKRDYISNALEELNQNRAGLAASLQGLNPDSAEAQQIQARIEAFYEVENGLINQLKLTYPLNSPQANACNNMMQINNAEMKNNAIKMQIKKMDQAVGTYMTYLNNTEPDSPQAQRIQAQIDALNKIKTALVEQQKAQVQLIKEQRIELKQNILQSPKKDRAFLADIRADHLNADNQFSRQRLVSTRNEIIALRKELRNEQLTKEQTDAIRLKLRSLYDAYRAERREYSVNVREERFWNRVEKQAA